MKLLVDWLHRLRTASGTPDELREHVFRAIVPGLHTNIVTDTLIKLEPVGRCSPRPGLTDPSAAALLRFFDTLPRTLRTSILASEIGALLALASGQQIEVAMELLVKVEGQLDTFFLGLGPTIDRTCRGPITPGAQAEFIESLSRVESLDPGDLEALSAASNLHYAALLLSDHDLRSAYLLLVSALEVLSRQFGVPPTDWHRWEGSEAWDALFQRVALSDEQASVVREFLMKDRQLRLKATFRDYAATRLPDSFWDQEWEEWLYPFHTALKDWGGVERHAKPIREVLPFDRDLLFRSLGYTYDIRSSLVHKGVHIDRLSMGVRAGAPVEPTEPLPYAVLRAVVRALIRIELSSRSEVIDLPDIRFI